jgi:uncharacterized membrane protein
MGGHIQPWSLFSMIFWVVFLIAFFWGVYVLEKEDD